MDKDIKIDGHSYSSDWVKSHSEQQFIDEFKNTAHIYPGEADKTVKLKAAYAAIKSPKDEKGEKPAPVLADSSKPWQN
jgi:hypothetical protein